MWIKDSAIDSVPQKRGTSVNLNFTYDVLSKCLSRIKIKQLYAFILTCLPYISIDGLEDKTVPLTTEKWQQFFNDNPSLNIVVWFCVILKLEFKPDVGAIVTDIHMNFDRDFDYHSHVRD
jgi:hypothetical protein